jgi:predicted acylesterase/phospholipase RssA
MTGEHRAQLSLEGARAGRLGLALSGGGFRAALFHVGVLARLADCDLLRHVAVISTVSGGAIIGAYYYLKLKQLLEGRREDGLVVSTGAYRKLVREIETEFLAALQCNVRMLTFADRLQNARMLASDYSSSQRLADLFDQYFFGPVSGGAPATLGDLPIEAAAGISEVMPRLIVNATALNTGHLFQITGRTVGEPDLSEVIGTHNELPLLRRLDLDDPALSSRQRSRLGEITLGQAVAASCCVPGMFEPFSLAGLYQGDDGGEIPVRLVDGGVFDNQGVVSLLEAKCSHFVCSDASERLPWQAEPPELLHQVALRANDIMMGRIRSEIMAELYRFEADRYAVFTLGDADGGTAFGDDSQRFLDALRDIRTDLDSFSDSEACALMYHGYQLSGHHLGQGTQEPGAAWEFLRVETLASEPLLRRELLHQLEVGARQFMKVFRLGKILPWVIIILPLLIPIGFSFLLIYLLPPIPTSAWVVLGLLVLTAVAYVQNARIIEWLDQIAWVRRARMRLAGLLAPVGFTMVLGAIGAVASWINLRVFNRLFLRYGRLAEERSDKLKSRPG